MKNKKITIITIIYSLIAIAIIYMTFQTLIDSAYFFNFESIIFLFVLFILALPYVFLLLNKKRQNDKFVKGIIIYEVIVIGFVLIFWFMWPSIKESVSGCWNCVSYPDGTEVCGVCD